MLGIFCLFAVMIILLSQAARTRPIWSRTVLVGAAGVMLALLIYTSWGAGWIVWLVLALPIVSVIIFGAHILIAGGGQKRDEPRKFRGRRTFRVDDES